MNRPIPMSQDELVATLKDILFRVQDGDSFEGSIEYMMPGSFSPDDPEDAYAMVRASYRIGNQQGQGGMRMIGRYDEQLALREFERQGALEDAAENLVEVARLRQVLAANGLEDPTWRNLSEREKQVLRDGDEKVLAESGRRLPNGMGAA